MKCHFFIFPTCHYHLYLSNANMLSVPLNIREAVAMTHTPPRTDAQCRSCRHVHWPFTKKWRCGSGADKATLSFLRLGHRPHNYPGETADQIAAKLLRLHGTKYSPAQPRNSSCGHQITTSHRNTQLLLPSN